MNILHIDFERNWRGGQQQAVYLYKKLIEHGINSNFICRSGSKLAEYFKSEKIPYYNIDIINEIDIFAALKISRIVKKHNFSIIVLHSAHALSIGILIKLFFVRNIKLVAIRRVDFTIRKNFLSLLKYSNKYVDIIVVISRFIEGVLLKDGISKDKLKLIYSAIDLEKFENLKKVDDFKKNYNIPEHHTVIGTVAALVDHKDYPTLLRAAELVLKNRSDITFFIAGDGNLKQQLVGLAAELGISRNIIFAGYIKDAWKILLNFDIFLITSKMEGLGTTILDAQAVGLPIIATAGGGIPEIVKDGYNGLLAPIGDYKKVAEHIFTLLENKELKDRLSFNGRKFVQNFSIEKQFFEYLDLFNILEKN